MVDRNLVQRAYTLVLEHFVRYGRAPHYTELGSALSLRVDEARVLLREAAAGAPAATCWLCHDTDYVEAWGPFSNVPTQHQVSVEGRQAWYAL
jgi:hypothetical protein